MPAVGNGHNVKTIDFRLLNFLAPLCAIAISLALVAGGCGGGGSSPDCNKPPLLTGFLKATGCSGGPTVSPTPTISAALWGADGESVFEFLPSQLAMQGVSTPNPAIDFVVHGAVGVAFDSAGDLWAALVSSSGVGGTAPPSLEGFTPADLSQSPPFGPSPSVVIAFSGFANPVRDVFDANSDLWVSDSGNNSIFEYAPAQLRTGGSNVTPNITITSNPPLNQPAAIAFDSAGDLWVANTGSTTIFEFSAASLSAAAGSAVVVAPNVILSDDGNGSIQTPSGLAFDASGNLWSSNTSTIVEFAKSVLGASGSPIPAVTISSTQLAGEPTIIAPSGIAFDNLGDLAVENEFSAAYGTSLFGKSQIGASGAPIPNALIGIGGGAGIAFGPVH